MGPCATGFYDACAGGPGARCTGRLFEYTVSSVDRDAPVILPRARALRRIPGMPDALTLRLEVRVPPGLQGALVVEQRLSRRDVVRMLAAFDGGR